MNLEEKMNTLSKMTADSEQWVDGLDAWKHDIQLNSAWAEYQTFDCSKMIIAMLNGIIQVVNHTLQEQDDPIQRAALKADRTRCLWLLSFYTTNFQLRTEDIVSQVDEALETLGS